MATSSITHNFVISNPNSVKLFIAAIDEAERDRLLLLSNISIYFTFATTISHHNAPYKTQSDASTLSLHVLRA